MRYAIITDIHGNLEAFDRVYADIKRSKIDKIICLGDIIGYGPDPEKVVEFFVKKKIPCVRGNHEIAVSDDYELNNFNKYAYDSIILTRKLISEKSKAWIKKLPKNLIIAEMLFVHGCPEDDPDTYIVQLSEKEMKKVFKSMKQKICFVGHTHISLLYSYRDRILAEKMGKGEVMLEKGKKYIINVGSVGQPRDGNNNAKYAIFDDKKNSVEIRYVAYDIEKTAEKIIRSGFPRFNAERLR